MTTRTEPEVRAREIARSDVDYIRKTDSSSDEWSDSGVVACATRVALRFAAERVAEEKERLSDGPICTSCGRKVVINGLSVCHDSPCGDPRWTAGTRLDFELRQREKESGSSNG